MKPEKKNSLHNASQGIKRSWRQEKNMKLHTAAALYTVAAGVICRVSATEWAILIISIALVMGLELINTALETTLDVLHPDFHPSVGLAKDIAAGAVLLFAAMALLCGGLIFTADGRIFILWHFIKTSPIAWIFIPLGTLLTLYFYKKTPKK